MMSLWDALRMNMMISYQELVRTFLNLIENPYCYAQKKALFFDFSPRYLLPQRNIN